MSQVFGKRKPILLKLFFSSLLVWITFAIIFHFKKKTTRDNGDNVFLSDQFSEFLISGHKDALKPNLQLVVDDDDPRVLVHSSDKILEQNGKW